MTSFDQYLNEIARYPLLSGEQEIQLSRQVRRMLELQAAPGIRTKREQREIRRGTHAHQTLMRCNLRLVVHVAKRFTTRLKCNGMEMMDLIQEGAIGLHRACELFDGTKGYKFSTYAYWWIRQGITRAIDTKERLIRVPQHTLDAVYRATRIQREHLQQHGHPMPLAELAELMEMKPDDLQMIMQRNIPHTSLDQLVCDDGSPLLDLIPSDDDDMDDSLTNEYSERLHSAMSNLEERDRLIISRYHGFGTPKQSQKQIAEEMGVTRARVGQGHDNAMRRLRLMITQKI